MLNFPLFFFFFFFPSIIQGLSSVCSSSTAHLFVVNYYLPFYYSVYSAFGSKAVNMLVTCTGMKTFFSLSQLGFFCFVF